jgi:hypothetical protein
MESPVIFTGPAGRKRSHPMRGIFNLICGVVMILGGLSGELVLKGTESGGALAALGVVVLGFGFFQMFRVPADSGPAQDGSHDDVR